MIRIYYQRDYRTVQFSPPLHLARKRFFLPPEARHWCEREVKILCINPGFEPRSTDGESCPNHSGVENKLVI